MKIARRTLIGLLILIFTAGVVPVSATSPYEGFTYNFWANAVPAPIPYEATRSISAQDIDPELGVFNNPMDLSVSINNHIYLLDSGNNRIVVFDQDLILIRVIDAFILNGEESRFNNPSGIFVCANLNIYIADTNNLRVVILDTYGNLLSIIYNPDFGDIDDEVIFRPLRVVADRAGRVYVIVQHVFEGIMRFDEYGEFFGYFGTINVRVSAADLFWRAIATQEQRARQRRFVPTEFTGLDVDEYGFIFTTHSGTAYSRDMVMRLNPRGNNILRNFNDNTDISGLQTRGHLLNSSFVDVVSRENGKFSVLDGTQNRIYTYDSEGNLLYVFGGEGNMMGMTRRSVAIDVVGEHIIVLDALRGRIIYFEPTEYGSLINQAIGLRYQGDEDGSLQIWRQLMTLNEHSELAFTGLGRSHLMEGQYELAMDYLRRGMDLRYYSMALGRRREVFIEQHLPVVLTISVVVIIVFIGWSLYKKAKHSGFEEDGVI